MGDTMATTPDEEESESESTVTGAKLAAQLNCHHTTVSRWRNGHRLPGVELLHRIAEVTEIPYEEIYTAWKGGEKTFAPFFRMRILGEPR